MPLAVNLVLTIWGRKGAESQRMCVVVLKGQIAGQPSGLLLFSRSSL